MRNVLITGAASGLGRGFLEHYKQQAETTCYAVDKSARLVELDSHTRWYTIDLTDEDHIDQFADELRQMDTKLDLVIHCAGVRGLEMDKEIKTQEDVQCAEQLDVVTKKTMLETFNINCVGTFLLLRILIKRLRGGPFENANPTGSSVNDEEMRRSDQPKVVVVGSRMGSIGHNATQGAGYSYRASKAALNAVVKSFSIDFPQATFTIIHPGRVESGLVPIKEDGAMAVEVAIKDCISLVDKLQMGDTGRFVDRFGVDIPW